MAARFALIALGLAACAGDRRAPGTAADTAAGTPEAPAMTLDGSGAGCVRVGMTLPELAPGCLVISRDTVPGPEGMAEDRAAVRAGGDPLHAVLVRDTVWRIEVTRPGLATDDGIGVGSSAGELLARPASAIIGGEGNLFVTLGARCGMSFELGGLPPEVKALPPDAARGRIPEGTTISRILIFGCPVE
ncbi:MAG TPA: hypothetical protein VF037_01340 [Gemmatimonadales bacterium]